VGLYEAPAYVALTVGQNLVMVSLDLVDARFYDNQPPFYYATNNCTGAPMMFLDMTRYGAVSSGLLYFPMGGQIATTYQSYRDSAVCQKISGTGVFAAVATLNVTNFQAPFTLVR
jgi:hypothetical protein